MGRAYVVGCIGALGLLGCLVGCKSSAGDPLEPLPGSGVAPPDQTYPEDNFGTTIGTVIRNYSFQGYVDPSQGMGEDHTTEISLGDFFNPTGDGVYGDEDLRPEGTPKPKALMINVSALWCGPCQQEARETLPEKYAQYHDQGFELLLVLSDRETPGQPAELEHLDLWTHEYMVSYPAVIDPTYQLGALFDQSQYPANFIVDPRTMEIVELIGGVPQEGFFQKIETVLAEDAP